MIRFRVISGTVNVTENCYLYEYLPDGKNVAEMFILDCGVAFPEMGMHGVDLIIPDFTYILENQDKVKGIIVSQGHEDHQGALPFLLKDMKKTVHAPELVTAFIEDKLADYQVKGVEVKTYDPDKDVIVLGSFKITPFRVTHSIPDTLGFSIDTPEGQYFHVAEHKFDPDPTIGKPFDVSKAKELASRGVVAMASDCLGSNRPGTTPPEKNIEFRIEKIVKDAKGAVFFSCISSNLARIQQAVRVAQRDGRKVAFVGRSIESKSMIAKDLGYLEIPDKMIVSAKEASRHDRSGMMYIVAGSFGQIGSSLFRIATGEHNFVSSSPNDVAILASNPGPPHSKENIDFLVDSFIDSDVETHYYDLGEELHVSGHGAQEDIKRLFDIVKPKHFIPIGGTIRYMHSYKKLVEEWGGNPKNVHTLKPGDSVNFQNESATPGPKISVKQVLVDGSGIGDVGKTVLSDRQALSENGVVVVMVKLNSQKRTIEGTPEIISRGFVFEKSKKGFLKDSANKLASRLKKLKKINSHTIRYMVVEFLSKHYFSETKRRPFIIPVVVES